MITSATLTINNKNPDKKETEQIITKNTTTPEINSQLLCFPYCVIWTKLPILSAIFPFIGHTAIGSSNGIVHEFAGDFLIGVNKLSFNKPMKYYKCDLNEEQKKMWDKAIEESDLKFIKSKHDLLYNNCHHHVAFVLNRVKYRNKKYATCGIMCLLCCKGKFVSMCAILQTYWLTLVLLIIIIVVVILCCFL